MKRAISKIIGATGLTVSVLVGSGCANLTDTQMGVLGNVLSAVPYAGSHMQSAVKVASAANRAATDITPEQEYYIGRAVAATILKQYRPYQNAALNRYINELGQSLALAGDRPQTFGGYHFLVLDTNEINAFSAPGGLILVGKGLIKVAGNEDELAAVLAHEIGHVHKQHGLASIEQSRLLDLGGALVKTGAQEFGGSTVSQLTGLFGETVGDITKTLLVNGYSRSQEREADQAAAMILKRIGYPSQALGSMLKKMKAQYPADKVGFAKTHPDPMDRLNDLQGLIGSGEPPASPAARQIRYTKAMSGV